MKFRGENYRKPNEKRSLWGNWKLTSAVQSCYLTCSQQLSWMLWLHITSYLYTCFY